MSGLTMIHNWFPNPYLVGSGAKPNLDHCTAQYWTNPPQLNLEATSERIGYARWQIDGLPAGESLTASALVANRANGERNQAIQVFDSSWSPLLVLYAEANTDKNLAGEFTVPSDGIVLFRLCSPAGAGKSMTYQRVIITESSTWEQVDALVHWNQPFGYRLMPRDRS